MRALVQRVSRAEVKVNGDTLSQIDKGLLVFLGIGLCDSTRDAQALAKKIIRARLFPDGAGRMNFDLKTANGSMLVVSQFTLFAELKRGNRPGFSEAAPSEIAEPLYKEFIAQASDEDASVATGVFGAEMEIELVNMGPVTLWYDTNEL
ncbi:MAG: D-tyrosyl-tRNA(Tyr) deacylase [Trueperaceae bacterium]|jgi:D-tyrosyl-tRNA(Tyr) deacylase|nr:D-tyrosyl-tRNA(Tyr) deacylase [Trueperaceae bacterium]|tara:strand:- start:5918 stop:6364 length:447 start_codon:yes stop_codon:yes gene_type:complete